MYYSYGICSFAFGKAKGTDSRMSAHIERTVHPKNADRTRTHLNRELVQFPEGSEEPHTGNSAPDRDSRYQAQGGHQPGEGQSGTAHRKQQGHEANGSGRTGLTNGATTDLQWLRETYGERNLVSAVLHMDEKTPHIHATIVPIVTGERRKAKKEEQNGKKKYRKKSTQDVRLCADDVMARHKAETLSGHLRTSHEQVRLAERRGRFAGKTHTDLAILQGTGRTTRQPAGEHRNLLGLEEEAQKKLKKVKGEIDVQKMKNAAVNATTAIADRVSSLWAAARSRGWKRRMKI